MKHLADTMKFLTIVCVVITIVVLFEMSWNKKGPPKHKYDTLVETKYHTKERLQHLNMTGEAKYVVHAIPGEISPAL